MIFSEQWLREWVNPALGTEELVARITMAGLEVDGHAPAAAEFSGVIVGEVRAVESHPDADKLRVCTVNDGHENHQVVCGAPNVAAGQKIPYAKLGARLGPDFKIRKAKLRGVESFGMICSAEELGLAEQSDGIMPLSADAQPGLDFRDYLGLDDTLIEVDLTPNRGDCLSITGLAREVGVLNRAEVTFPVIDEVAPTVADSLPIELKAPADCPRYLGRVIRNLDPSAGSPLWLREKLRRSGLRSIDPIVDVTNYVLMELGQPMHAFDLGKLVDGIVVRRAEPGEKLTLLDGKEVALREDTLLIADREKPLAMAGVMGGLDSAVTESTRDILLESAFFSPLTIAGTARSYGLQTDAAHRFERGVDFEMPRRAMERATALLLDICGGEAGPIVEAMEPDHLPDSRQVHLRAARAATLLGITIPNSEIVDILERLGLAIAEHTEDGWRVKVPSWRFDIAIEADLIEELARIHGYDKLPATRYPARIKLKPQAEATLEARHLRRALAALGYQEVINYSFVEASLDASLRDGEAGESIGLANPISQDMAVMRGNLWPGLIKTLKHNQNRQQNRVRIFESGLRFTRRAAQVEQTPALAGLLWGARLPEQWAAPARANDFFDLKGDVESLLALTRDAAAFRFQAASHPALQDGQSARLLRGDTQAGWLGALDPALQRQLDIPGKAFLFELDLQVLQQAAMPVASELSRYPSVRRDLAMVLDAGLEISDIIHEIQLNAGETLSNVVVFDVYQGENIEKSKKSLALGLTFQHPSRTLNDDEINGIIDTVIKVLEAKFNAELRK